MRLENQMVYFPSSIVCFVLQSLVKVELFKSIQEERERSILKKVRGVRTARGQPALVCKLEPLLYIRPHISHSLQCE